MQTSRTLTADLTYLAIDLDKAKAHLDAAKAALAHDNDQAARDSLAAVGSDAGNRAAAMTDLHQASQSLRNYRTGDHVGDARILASTIDTDTTGNGNASPSIGSKIENWWSSVAQWARQKV